MKAPHKHAELIKAWADGAEIECYSVLTGRWVSCDLPLWRVEYQYRIKPEKKWYRVAEFFSINRLGTYVDVADNSSEESRWADAADFSRWITDRIYYE